MSGPGTTAPRDVFITPPALLDHWQGHRALTRRVIDAFPDDQLFSFSLGDMRPFGLLTHEMIRMTIPFTRGLATGAWEQADLPDLPDTKAGVLDGWDRDTVELGQLWPQIAPGRFQERDAAFGRWEGVLHDLTLYVIDNEIHHRGQGYVYLRSLGVEPPHFWARG